MGLGSVTTERRVQELLDRLTLQSDCAKLNPLLGDAVLLEDAVKMLNELRNKLRFCKPYDEHES